PALPAGGGGRDGAAAGDPARAPLASLSWTAYRPAMRMHRVVLRGIGILFATASQLACSSDGDSTGKGGSGGSTGVGGSAGGSTGQAGAAGGSTGAAGAPAAT